MKRFIFVLFVCASFSWVGLDWLTDTAFYRSRWEPCQYWSESRDFVSRSISSNRAIWINDSLENIKRNLIGGKDSLIREIEVEQALVWELLSRSALTEVEESATRDSIRNASIQEQAEAAAMDSTWLEDSRVNFTRTRDSLSRELGRIDSILSVRGCQSVSAGG
jgi:hypothetical protein